MDCEKIRELLLTDYLDKEADITQGTRVQKHLESCTACKRFEQELRRAAVEPFKNAATPEAPESVWLAIKEKIAEREGRRVTVLDVIRQKLEAFFLPRPALAFASAMVIVLIMSGVIAKYKADKDQVKDYFAQQLAFYAMLDNGEGNESFTGEKNNPLQEYVF